MITNFIKIEHVYNQDMIYIWSTYDWYTIGGSKIWSMVFEERFHFFCHPIFTLLCDKKV
jgi:hypothetical protein